MPYHHHHGAASSMSAAGASPRCWPHDMSFLALESTAAAAAWQVRRKIFLRVCLLSVDGERFLNSFFTHKIYTQNAVFFWWFC